MPAGLELPPAETLEHQPEPFWWQRRWASLSRPARRLVGALVAVLLLAAGALWLRDQAVDRALEQRIVLTTSLQVWASSTSPPGGEVGYSVLIRNDGALPLSVTSVEASADRLRLRMRDDGDRRIPPAGEVAVPISVRLTCGGTADREDGTGLPAEIGVRSADGGPATQRVLLQPAALLLDVAATLCRVRPGLRDHELSGPVLKQSPEMR